MLGAVNPEQMLEGQVRVCSKEAAESLGGKSRDQGANWPCGTSAWPGRRKVRGVWWDTRLEVIGDSVGYTVKDIGPSCLENPIFRWSP